MENVNKTNEENKVQGDENNQTEKTEKTYTQEELDKLLQSESDRRVTQALKKQREELENNMDKKLREAEKLRSMDESQRKEYEMQKRISEVEKKEKEFALMENKIECGKILESRGIPQVFLDYVVAEDAETMIEKIDTFDKVFKSALADEVNKKIAKKTPTGSYKKQTGMTREQFMKLPIEKQSEIYRTNPTLFKELTGK